MEKVMTELDANFLMAAALGYSCMVYDYGSRRGITTFDHFNQLARRGCNQHSRAQFLFVRFILDSTGSFSHEC